MAVTHLVLGGGVGGTPGLVQDFVVEAGVTPFPWVIHREMQVVFLVVVWTIGKDVCSCLTREVFHQFPTKSVNEYSGLQHERAERFYVENVILTNRLLSELLSDGLFYASVNEENNTFSGWCTARRQSVRKLYGVYLSQSILLLLKCCLFTP